MLRLPIDSKVRTESETADADSTGKTSDDVLGLLPGREGFYEELVAGSANADGQPMRLSVKNTFLDIKPEQQAATGAQTCTARLSGTSSMLFTPDATPQGAGAWESGAGLAGAWPPNAADQAPAPHRDPVFQAEGRERRLNVKNTFIEVEDPDASPANLGTQSCTARLSAGSQDFGFAEVAGGYSVGPPACAPPAFAPPSAPPPMPPSAASNLPVGLNMTVKNTFIEYSDPDATGRNDQRTNQTCTARFSDPSPSFSLFPPTPQGGAGSVEPTGLPLTRPPNVQQATSPMTVPLLANAPGGVPNLPPPMHEARVERPKGLAPGPTAPQDPWGAAPDGIGASLGYGLPVRSMQVPLSSGGDLSVSLGSALHGSIGSDGQLACRPCAWFYKEGSCTNAKACGYCHLCPYGELKNRKKTKIAQLRQAEAEAAAITPTASAASPTGGSKKVFLLSGHV